MLLLAACTAVAGPVAPDIDSSPPSPTAAVEITVSVQHDPPTPPALITEAVQIPSPAATNTPELTPAQDPVFPLSRPILPPGRVVIDPTYRFGTSHGGERELHHGVEFLNSQGTPVHAAGEGVVLFAGDDYNGSPYSPRGWFAFYGLFVILEHDFSGLESPVYTLYGHLSEVSVETGQTVANHQQIGLVGFTGAAVGSHLHFEVRYGGTTYSDSRNPEIWLAPEPENGSLVGRIRDANDLPVPVLSLQLSSLDNPAYTQYFSTYEDASLSFQLPFEENFAIGNLPPGMYELSFIAYKLEKHTIEILPGELTQVEIIIGEKE